ncbi:MAG: threonylcarbamoyl-AMP synthase [Bacteroidales bacterium]|nr:threonylcarbamoyl-AMP synthase [Bacteroidales bacterium]
MKEEINKTLDVLRKGGIIIYPTDTVWGIGCDATNNKAVQRIFRLKKRMDHKSMIVLICNAANINTIVEEVPDLAFDLMDSWNKPLTIVYDNAKNLAKKLISADKTIGVRVTRNKFNQALIKELGHPIVSTSANFSGQDTPLFFADIDKKLLDSVDHVVNFERDITSEPKPSTVIRIHPDGNFDVLRK